MKKILIVIPTIETGGGAEKVASSLGNILNKKEGYNINLLTFYHKKQEQVFLGERIDLGESKKGLKLIKLIKRAVKIRKICKDKKINTAISFIEEANFSLVLSKFLGNRSKMIVSVRNDPLTSRDSFFYKLLITILYPFVFNVATNSKEAEAIINKNFHVKNTVTIYNNHTIDRYNHLSREGLENFKGEKFLFDKDQFTFINIGRLSEQKGHVHLLRAFSKVLEKFKDANLIILGSGDKESELKSLAEEIGVIGRVFFKGKVRNVFPYLSKSDCFVLSSLREGLPNVIIEALACGLPVISTDCKTGPRELLAPNLKINQELNYPFLGEYGILSESFRYTKDNDEAEGILAEAMLRIIKDYELRKSYSIKSLKRAKDFDENKIVAEWEKII